MVKLLFRSGMIGAFALHLLLGGFYTEGLRVTELAAQQVQTVMTLSSDAASLLSAPANLEVRDVTLGEALDELRSASRISLAYSPSLLPSDHRVSCDCRTVTVAEALDHLLKGTSLRFATVREQILIEPARIRIQALQRTSSFAHLAHATPVMALPSSGEAFDRVMAGRVMAGRVMVGTVTGRVTDASSGAPLSGVQVSIVGTQLGAISGQDGRYSITGVPDGVQQVQADIIGYAQASQEVTISDGQIVTADFALETEAVALEGIVAVGYGTRQRRDVTGAIGSVSAEEIEQVQVPTVSQALQGRVAGVQVTRTSSAPGGGVSIRIRGSGSLGTTNEPLYVVDGIPISGGDQNDPRAGDHSRNSRPDALAFLSPNDIASIEILKDASSTAIYGARGTNGVVLITTKKGRAGQARMEFESSVGVQSAAELLPVLDASQYAEFANANARYLGVEEPFPSPASLGEGPDWESLVLRNAVSQNHSVSVLGGTETTRFAISGSATDQQGVVKNSDFQRYSVRGNISHDVRSWLTLGTNLNASRINSSLGMSDAGWSQGPATSVMQAVYGIPRIFPVYNEEGQHFDALSDCPPEIQAIDHCSRYFTPLSFIEGVLDHAEYDRVLGNVYADAILATGLTLRVNGAANLLNNTRDRYFSRVSQVGRGANGLALAGTIERTHLMGEGILNYEGFFGDLHTFDATVGATIEHEDEMLRQMENSNFPNDITRFYSIGDGTREGGPSIESSFRDWTLLSYLGRLNYGFADKYLFTLTGRADGSSKFGADNKWGFFPSAAFAWRVSAEPFLAGADWLTDLKFRVSWGQTGNQEIGTYRSLATLSTTVYPYGDDVLFPGYYPSSVANAELRWEKSNQVDIGFDAAFLDNRFTITVDLYNKTTEDLLMDVPLPIASGFGSALMNVGRIRNRGIEVSFGMDVLRGTTGPRWSTNFNIAANRNEVLDIGGTDELYGGGTSTADGLLVREGEPLGMFWGYRTDGVFATQAEVDAYVNAAGEPIMPGVVPGQRRFVDTNGDGAITPDDRTFLGNPEPDFTFGWTNDISWGDFSLYSFIQGTYGNAVYNGNIRVFGGAAGRNLYEPLWVNRWTPENPGSEWPAFFREPGTGWSSPGGGRHEDPLVEDGSYLRLRSVSLSYNVPAAFTERLVGMQNAQIFLNVENLFTWTDYRGPNPDVNWAGQNNINRGIDSGAYPLAKTYRLGIRFGL